MADPDLLIIGAGAAGIAAARAALATGETVQVLEARDRPGGRAWTDATTLAAPFDLGATWLHAAAENPLVPLARELGVETFDHDAARSTACFIDGRRATPEEVAEYETAYAEFHRVLRAARPDAAPDADAARHAPRGGVWDASVAHWEGPVICAAPLAAMDLRDFLDTQLAEGNLLPRQGAGALLARLAEGLPIAYSSPVTRLSWGGPGVVAEGGFGRVAARRAIVTVPTGVLAASAIRFDPALPPQTEAAIHDLPLGLLTKLGLRAAGTDRLDLLPFAGLERQVAREDETAMTFVAWPFGQDHLMGFLGGPAAWALADQPDEALVELALEELTKSFGSRAGRAIRRDGFLASHWGRDPYARGAYSHARPGRQAARSILAQPLADGRLTFAGEACHPRLAATLGGAWESGANAVAGLK